MRSSRNDCETLVPEPHAKSSRNGSQSGLKLGHQRERASHEIVREQLES